MSTIYDREWEDVTIRAVYLDHSKVKTRDVRLNREEIEEEEREALRQRAEENADITPELIESFQISPDFFKGKVVEAARTLATEPLHLPPENESNVLRILAPSAIKEIQITVNNLAKVIIA